MSRKFICRFCVVPVFFFVLLLFAIPLFGQEDESPAIKLGEMGKRAFEKGRLDEAVEHYTKGLDVAIGGERVKLLNGRGRAYLSLLRYGDAVSDFTEALVIEPKFGDALFGRAVAFLNLGRYDNAKDDIGYALKIDSSRSEYHTLLGRLKTLDGDFKGALNDFDRALNLDGKSSAALNGRGYAFLGLEQYDFSSIDFKRAMELDPNFSPPYRGMAMVYLNSKRDGDVRSALSFAEKAVKLDRNHQNLDTLASILYKMGMDEATDNIDAISRAVKAEREAIELLNERGTLGEKARFAGEYELRLKRYENALMSRGGAGNIENRK